ncbi:MAG: hypothetical protein PHQ86_06795 [Dehalococcoidales bacterium]|nr:hypothetical protein [Dehalococcoidales bacterium]
MVINGYTAEEINKLVNLAKTYKLITTGGSDFHCLNISKNDTIDSADVTLESAKQLIALAEKQTKR